MVQGIAGVDRPVIVCLCGSTRFMHAFQEANLQETLAGRIVLSVGCNTKNDSNLGLSEEVKTNLDRLHLYKIDLADEVLILNFGGYVGASTAREIVYAWSHRKRLRWLVPPVGQAFPYEGQIGGAHRCESGMPCNALATWWVFLKDGEDGWDVLACEEHAFLFGAPI